jgi:MoaA/NifB/PqqE/SkfB family radical SAM enzyme
MSPKITTPVHKGILALIEEAFEAGIQAGVDRERTRIKSALMEDPILSAAPASTSPPAVPGTFCVKPFLELNVMTTGIVKPCCLFYPTISNGDRPMSVYENDIMEIWNSDDMLEARRKLVNGQPLRQCAYCYAQEGTGANSLRIDETAGWAHGALNPKGETIQDLKVKAVLNDFSVPAGPEWVNLDVGNLCNLKCRMCHPNSSSEIAADPVHSRWSRNEFGKIARWKGDSLIIAPEPVVGIEYIGVYHDHSSKTPIAWLNDHGIVRIPKPDQRVFSIYLKLAQLQKPNARFTIALNDVILFDDQLPDAEWEMGFELPDGLRQETGLELKLDCTAPVGIEQIKLIKQDKGKQSVAFGRFPSGKQWFQDQNFMKLELLRNIDTVKKLSLVGGEPFLIKELRPLLRHFVETGAASHVTLVITTNATKIDDVIIELASQFQKLLITVSLEGYGDINEYIRYPSKWADVEDNIKRLQSISNATVAVNFTVQAYNMLHVAELAEFCDVTNLEFRYWCLTYPDYLSVNAMPVEVRRAAVAKLRKAASELKERRRLAATEGLLKLALIIDNNTQPADDMLLKQFMMFTNDLDLSRGQKISHRNSELVEIIEASGTQWAKETRFVDSARKKSGRTSLPQGPKKTRTIK